MSYKPFYLQGTGPDLITAGLIEEFARENPKLAENIDNYDLELKTLDLDHLESFCAWVLSQQISGRVAETLLHRFRQLLGEITPDKILNVSLDQLRGIGLSRTKAKYVKNIAKFFKAGHALEDHDNYSSQEIQEHYMQIKGIGPWTVNMFLIFNLGRLDVAAPKDLVVRKGLQVLYELDAIPDERQSRKLMERWGDLATIGTIMSWAAMGE